MNKFILYIFICLSFSLWSQSNVDKQTFIDKTHTIQKVNEDTSSNIPGLKFEEKIKDKYSSSEFEYEIKTSELSAWDRFKQWLAKVFKELFGLSNTNISEKYVDLTLRIICAAIVLYVIYLIVKIILNKEGNWAFGKNSSQSIINYDEIEKNLIQIDFEKLIKETLAQNNHRLAIRYYYLFMLKKMSQKGIIEWQLEKTNSDYEYEIKDSKLKNRFKELSYLYNYIWYGEFDIEDSTFNHSIATFQNILKTL